MPSLKDIKRRIRSVKNTSQITKAMEVVSATKMRRSQGIAIAGRPYALAALDILKNVASSLKMSEARPPGSAGRITEKPSLLQRREIKKTLLLVITSDKGLAGAFNSNVLRLVERWMREHTGENYAVSAVGKKSLNYFTSRGIIPERAFTDFGDYVSRDQTEPLSVFMLEGYLLKAWDRAIVFYTNFRTTLKQEAKMVEVLPINPEKIADTIKGITPEHGRFAPERGSTLTETRINADYPRESAYRSATDQRYHYEYKFEPSPAEVLEKLLPTLFKIQMHHIVLESNASEHSARMVAMKNASENAKELIGELTIEYNKSRQSGITRELTEITAGREALEG